MNFGLANNIHEFSFAELNSDEIEVVSGGSGGMMNYMMAAGAGLGIAASGGSLLYASTGTTLMAAGVTTAGAMAVVAVGAVAVVGGIGLAGYGLYRIFG